MSSKFSIRCSKCRHEQRVNPKTLMKLMERGENSIHTRCTLCDAHIKAELNDETLQKIKTSLEHEAKASEKKEAEIQERTIKRRGQDERILNKRIEIMEIKGLQETEKLKELRRKAWRRHQKEQEKWNIEYASFLSHLKNGDYKEKKVIQEKTKLKKVKLVYAHVGLKRIGRGLYTARYEWRELKPGETWGKFTEKRIVERMVKVKTPKTIKARKPKNNIEKYFFSKLDDWFKLDERSICRDYEKRRISWKPPFYDKFSKQKEEERREERKEIRTKLSNDDYLSVFSKNRKPGD